MGILMSVVAGLLIAAAVYLMLSKQILRIIIGTAFLSHGAHLLLLTMGGLKTGAPPLLGEKAPMYTDPLPQALILTAIVISFGVTSFFLVLAYRAHQELGTVNTEEMRGNQQDE
ncbi:Na(+)/H(+) antiporter subunit C [Bacillus sp. HMF5848]|uniref:Na(+)/H(+) antiporter subunit C n=1 Tax=Bacillus sp. HMF5848 TaxID=2495421 RepID=UPI000F7BAB75|nr:Na(+)/H(+) antiporter subunit C [Bacillus sp. HMF5848]RSK28587.1 Na(+)/H(+) antiporter subunit C [Bacillus sp. HMF5848]